MLHVPADKKPDEEIGDTLHGANAPTESEHEHKDEVPEEDKPENQSKPESETK